MTDEELLGKFLDGSLTRLEAEDFAKRRKVSRALDVLARRLSEPPESGVVPGPDFDARVVRAARMRAAAKADARPARRWALPGPVWAFAAAVLAFVAGAFFGNPAARLPRAPGGVEFALVEPGARAVSVVGEFNGWDPNKQPMTREGGVWKARVALPPGVYEYQFVVDGHLWVPDPAAAASADDGFGRVNSVVHVATTSL